MQGSNNSRIGMNNSRKGFDDDSWGYGKKNTRGSKARGTKISSYKQEGKNKQRKMREAYENE